MTKNRKNAETYRFIGHLFLHAHSIHCVTIADLELAIQDLETKLADPLDQDAKTWTARWFKRYRKELDKKIKGRDLKQREKVHAAKLSRVP